MYCSISRICGTDTEKNLNMYVLIMKMSDLSNTNYLNDIKESIQLTKNKYNVIFGESYSIVEDVLWNENTKPRDFICLRFVYGVTNHYSDFNDKKDILFFIDIIEKQFVLIENFIFQFNEYTPKQINITPKRYNRSILVDKAMLIMGEKMYNACVYRYSTHLEVIHTNEEFDYYTIVKKLLYKNWKQQRGLFINKSNYAVEPIVYITAMIEYMTKVKYLKSRL